MEVISEWRLDEVFVIQTQVRLWQMRSSIYTIGELRNTEGNMMAVNSSSKGGPYVYPVLSKSFRSGEETLGSSRSRIIVTSDRWQGEYQQCSIRTKNHAPKVFCTVRLVLSARGWGDLVRLTCQQRAPAIRKMQKRLPREAKFCFSSLHGFSKPGGIGLCLKEMRECCSPSCDLPIAFLRYSISEGQMRWKEPTEVALNKS